MFVSRSSLVIVDQSQHIQVVEMIFVVYTASQEVVCTGPNMVRSCSICPYIVPPLVLVSYQVRNFAWKMLIC